ncbi:MAG: 2,3-diphosphoglycerate-dependent phosphoglycerate mutase [Phycisphaerae bacterium]|jgi:2,3-bisphosphoglycerate-dependent phosphoglycerate mutase
MQPLVLLRHGESVWNKENLFTGWTDVGLTDRGVQEANDAAELLIQNNYTFDIAFTSVLKRSLDTLDIVLRKMQLTDIPIEKSWRLNERHYGALQGLNKSQTTEKYGEQQVHIWRRSYDVRPPALEENDPRLPAKDPLYKDIEPSLLPRTECLKDVVARFLPYWNAEIVPVLKDGKKILICAHGNSMRALVKYLDNVPDEEISELNIPTGVPLIYELDEQLGPIRHFYLGDAEEIERKRKEVANQAKRK